MPIKCDIELTPVNQTGFHDLDYRITGLAFKAQNLLGNFLKEDAYKRKMAQLMVAEGIDVHTEARMTVTHGSFAKHYFCDMVANRSVLYELKASSSPAKNHQEQLLHYLFLSGLCYGKIFNFGAKSVDTYYVSTNYSEDERRDIQWKTADWLESEQSLKLLEVLRSLLHDWGIGLHLNLYEEALIHLLQGLLTKDDIIIQQDQLVLSSERWPVLGNTGLFHLSTIRKESSSYEKNLLKFLNLTPYTKLYWVNINKRDIHCKTLTG
jgi:GxxExxY protein